MRLPGGGSEEKGRKGPKGPKDAGLAPEAEVGQAAGAHMHEPGRFFSFRPRLVEALRGYSREDLRADVLAGITVGVVALPLAIAFGIGSGVTPLAGLWTAIVGGFVISALGGSRVQIGGPAGAFVGIVAMIVATQGRTNLLICTLMAGVILFVMGALRFGTMIRYIPHPVTTGFTCGIAVVILGLQLPDFLGLEMAVRPVDIPHLAAEAARALGTLNPWAAATAAVSTAIVAAWPRRWARFVPGSIVVVIAGTAAVMLFGLPVATVGSRFGAIPSGLPDLALPAVDWAQFGSLVRTAFVIAFLGAIESLLSAVVADGMIDDRHDSNQELMAQGAANFLVPFFGGIPVTGVIARTATNIRAGARTPMAGIVHALTLLLFVLVAAPLARHIPLATLAAVLAVVAARMGEWGQFRQVPRMPKSDALVFLTTFALTVIFDLVIAVEVGLVLAAGLFVKRIADTTQVHALAEGGEPPGVSPHERVADVPRGVMVYRVFGALMFGAAEKLDNVLRRMAGDTRVIILHMPAVTAMDATALNVLESLHAKLRRHGRHLILSGPHTQPFFMMEKAGFLDRVGHDNVAADLHAAVARARTLVK